MTKIAGVPLWVFLFTVMLGVIAGNLRNIALPTLVRRSPKPVRKIIGDLSDTAKVIAGLQLAPEGPLTP